MKATIFGANGLLGSELVNTSPVNWILNSPKSSETNLATTIPITDYNDLWFNCAAKVGGVKANTDQVADFYQINSEINNNVFRGAIKNQTSKLVSVLSTCIYPDAIWVNYPLTEDQLHLGPPHQSNFGYAFSKRMIDVQSRAYRQQYQSNFVTVIPNNLYGLNDNYHLSDSHVIPALIRKFYEAKQNKTAVTIWGTGNPVREFTFARDAARIMWWVGLNYNQPDPINIGNQEEISIGDLASLIAKIIEFKGEIKFDSSKPDGQLRKPSSNKKLLSLNPEIKFTPLVDGLTETIIHFESNYPKLRGM